MGEEEEEGEEEGERTSSQPAHAVVRWRWMIATTTM